jgi:hypothetical protein
MAKLGYAKLLLSFAPPTCRTPLAQSQLLKDLGIKENR